MDTFKNPVVSIIVASHRTTWIEDLCVKLLSQDCGTIAFEVIIVSDYCNEVLSAKFPDIQWIYLTDKSISTKRNRGIEVARGEIVAFTDDDCMPSNDWLRSGVEYLRTQTGVDGVEGLTRIERGAGLSGRMFREYTRLESRGYRTNNIFYYRSVLVSAGLFDTRFSVQREDLDLAFTLLTMGKVIDYCKDIKVTHRFREQERWDLLKNCWNRRFDPLLYKKHGTLYRTVIKSPSPKTVKTLFLIWAGIPVIFLLGSGMYYVYAVLCAIGLLGTWRIGRRRLSIGNIASETVSLLLAPMVLLAALLCGSVKSGKLLII